MNEASKEAKRIRKRIKYVLRTRGGRLELSGSEPGMKLLRVIGAFVDRMRFESREEGARRLGIKPTQYDYVVQCYRALLKTERKAGAKKGIQKKLGLAPVKIVDDPAPPAAALRNESRPEGSRVELTLDSGVKVSLESADAAIDLLERLAERKRPKAAP